MRQNRPLRRPQRFQGNPDVGGKEIGAQLVARPWHEHPIRLQVAPSIQHAFPVSTSRLDICRHLPDKVGQIQNQKITERGFVTQRQRVLCCVGAKPVSQTGMLILASIVVPGRRKIDQAR